MARDSRHKRITGAEEVNSSTGLLPLLHIADAKEKAERDWGVLELQGLWAIEMLTMRPVLGSSETLAG